MISANEGCSPLGNDSSEGRYRLAMSITPFQGYVVQPRRGCYPLTRGVVHRDIDGVKTKDQRRLKPPLIF
ncbi:MAG: hypothetical protein JST88_02705 [Bacteroidetes bacterium]|nr:hypothetical protein [Bacteroidota bacterium]